MACSLGVAAAPASAAAQHEPAPAPPEAELGPVPEPPAGPPPAGRAAPPPPRDPGRQPSPPPRRGVNVGFSSALDLGGGKILAPEDAREAVFDFALRIDMLFSPADRAKVWALGPAFELTSLSFDSLGVGGGVHLRLRLPDPFDVWWVAGLTRTYLPDAREGGAAFLSFGIGGRRRGRDECASPVCYEPRIGAYVTYREGLLGDDDVRVVTAGLEADISLSILILAAM